MGSRVRIRLFHILHFVRDLLFPLLKNSKSGVDDRGHRLRITHTPRRREVTLARFIFLICVNVRNLCFAGSLLTFNNAASIIVQCLI